MDSFFQNCSKIEDLTPLANWNVENVTAMYDMFNGCTNITDLSPLANWNVSNVTRMSRMFQNCSHLVNASGINSWSSRLNANLVYDSMFSSSTTTKPSWYV